MNDIEIHKSIMSDLRSIAKIFRIETAKKPYLQKWTEKTSLDKLKRALKEDDLWTIFLDKEIVGMVICKLDKKKKEVYLDELWIDGKHQSGGLGTWVMNYLEKFYQKR